MVEMCTNLFTKVRETLILIKVVIGGNKLSWKKNKN
jgi:hypothetical protein